MNTLLLATVHASAKTLSGPVGVPGFALPPVHDVSKNVAALLAMSAGAAHQLVGGRGCALILRSILDEALAGLSPADRAWVEREAAEVEAERQDRAAAQRSPWGPANDNAGPL